MPKHKIPRKSTTIDMTAMCDVAFLLLTFFMLATKFKPTEPVTVDTPTSVSTKLIPDNNVAIITVDSSGRVFYDLVGRGKRDSALNYMRAKYPVELTGEQQKQFILGSSIGCSMEQLPALLNLKEEERKHQDGVPTDSLNNQLADWLSASIYTNPNLPFVVKADRLTKYPKIKKVIDILQSKNVNKFSLVTGLEEKPKIVR